jgi:hypothetical protein
MSQEIKLTLCIILSYHAFYNNINTQRFLFYHLAAVVFYETHQLTLLEVHMMVELLIHSHDGIYIYSLCISNLKNERQKL